MAWAVMCSTLVFVLPVPASGELVRRLISSLCHSPAAVEAASDAAVWESGRFHVPPCRFDDASEFLGAVVRKYSVRPRNDTAILGRTASYQVRLIRDIIAHRRWPGRSSASSSMFCSSSDAACDPEHG